MERGNKTSTDPTTDPTFPTVHSIETTSKKRTITVEGTKWEILYALVHSRNSHIGFRIRRCAKEMGFSPNNIREHLQSLEKFGLAKSRNGRSPWQPTSRAIEFIDQGQPGVVMSERTKTSAINKLLKTRAHNIKVKFKVLATPKDPAWLVGWKVNDQMKNNTFYSTKFGEIGLTYTGSSLIFQMPVLVWKSADIANSESLRIASELAKRMQNEFKGLELGEKGQLDCQIITQHHAIQNDPFAKFLVENGITFRDSDLEVDASEKNIPEMEFTNNKEAHLHYERYTDHIKDIILNKVPLQSEIAHNFAIMQRELQALTLQVNGNAQGIKDLTSAQRIMIQSQQLQYQTQVPGIKLNQKNIIEPKLDLNQFHSQNMYY